MDNFPIGFQILDILNNSALKREKKFKLIPGK